MNLVSDVLLDRCFSQPFLLGKKTPLQKLGAGGG